ncbi:sulfate ABC transporter permease subunit [Frankia sp. AgB1.9]|uniref:sulfate ABC transporter permease subunit n=1 Tax=unclassified Frankia TaxID=2632575 RepID=UPI0019327BE2|nr:MULTISPECIES: sulfate ABC transporter permease subunit [unclassified Frankia]MBL7488969.1 sulfate ABC transporter permease subunit [Frankia sp. AgW1.1]MBL7546861.1 sulfate ABC transporter permease subunit [Frankia sp. AgB1.9]MBL7622531.1 sulfate ABC transporter permease subunit [Frankia sp. AgB1.8]
MGSRSAGRLVRRFVALAYVAVLVLVPLVVVVWKTVSPGASAFWSAISSHQAVTAFRLTAEISLASVALNTVFGVGLALLITRYRFPGRRLLNSLADLPISVSPIVVGLALVLVYGPVDGWFGRGLHDAGFNIIFAVPGMILATTFVSMPLILRELVPVLDEAGIDQEQAARVLGANAWQRFVRITIPIIRPALLYGIVLSLARSIGEFGAVLVVSGNVSGVNQTQTVPLLVSERIQQLEPGAYQLAFLLIVVTVLTIVVVNLRRIRSESNSGSNSGSNNVEPHAAVLDEGGL